MARLDRFTPVREIAQIGAAIGREFSYELVAAVAPMPQAQLDDALGTTVSGFWPSVGGHRPTPSTPSSTRWCRTRRITRYSRAADRSCTPRSPA